MLWAQGTAGTGRLVRAYGPPSGVASPPLPSVPAGPHVPLGSPVQKERLRCHTGPEVGLFKESGGSSAAGITADTVREVIAQL